MTKGTEQFLNLITLGPKLGTSQKLKFFVYNIFPIFSLKSSSLRTLGVTALTKLSLEAHHNNVECAVSRKYL